MVSLLIVIAVIVCVLLGAIVLIQNPKGGGLNSSFSASSQLMGVQKTGDFLEKGTWVLAVTLMVLSLAVNVGVKAGSSKGVDNVDKDRVEKATRPVTPVSQAPAGGLQLPQVKPDSAKK